MNTKVRTAVIPVAGFGTRFLPATKAQPKEMLPVVDKPGVQYLVEEAVAAGIETIVFVTGTSKRAVEDHFDINAELESRLLAQKKRELLRSLQAIRCLANFVYVRQSEPRGNADALLRAQPALGSEPFVYLYPDDLLLGGGNSVQRMLEVFAEYEAPVMAVTKVARRDVTKYGIIKNIPLGKGIHEVVKLVEKPSLAQAPSNLASIKGYVFPPTIFSYLRKVRPAANGEMFLTDAVAAYNTKHAVFACELGGTLYDLGSKLGWLKANIAIGLQRSDMRAELKRFLRTIL